MLFKSIKLLTIIILFSITVSGCGKFIKDRQDSILYLAENIDYSKLKNVKSEIKPFKNCINISPTCNDIGITQLFNSYYNSEKSCTGLSDIVKYYNLSDSRYYLENDKFNIKKLSQKYEPFSPKNNWLNERCKSEISDIKIVSGDISNNKGIDILVLVKLSKSKSGIYQLSAILYDKERLNFKSY